eukprot:TRINITY_DN12936_c0_g1_i1.p1 TRINITY_DN12936_c0_g1~~TRINITY_DN12936_c0_g1_i1.p1  ORF type:complete len:547 (-),score=67.34 TRINITY_DN12936_c0_g1_i1:612-2252(-)
MALVQPAMMPTRPGAPPIVSYRNPSPVLAGRRSVSMGPVRVTHSPHRQSGMPRFASPRQQSPASPPLTREEHQAWSNAARSFVMNSDFDVRPAMAAEKKLNIHELMNLMKAQSGGKGTIQALGDKIILSKLLDNLGIPQMPLLYSVYGKVDSRAVHKLVSNMEASGDPDAYDIVVKPTHLSSGTGALVLSKQRWEKESWTAVKLVKHMEQYLTKKAADCESEALKSLMPGFIVQPRYRSPVAFSFPLEMRVVTVWGKARLGVWWWGRQSEPKGRRTTWVVRCPKTPGILRPDDDWEALHEHGGDNRGFDVAVALFKEAMPAMAAAAEEIAVAVGAPFLRSDFFVGSPKWGIRLNEVAYGSGVDYKRRRPGPSPKASSANTSTEHVDDGPAIAQILQDGFPLCQQKAPSHFLRLLGAKTASYEPPAQVQAKLRSRPVEPHMRVESVPPEERFHQLPEDAVKELVGRYEDSSALQWTPVAAASCETQAPSDLPGPGRLPLHRIRSIHGATRTVGESWKVAIRNQLWSAIVQVRLCTKAMHPCLWEDAV